MSNEPGSTLHPLRVWGTGLVAHQGRVNPTRRASAGLRLVLAGVSAANLVLGPVEVWAQRRMPVIASPVPAPPDAAPGSAPPRPLAESAAFSSSAPEPVITPAAQAPAQINTGLVTIESDLQKTDQATGVVTATGNVRIVYPDQRVVATSRQAQYFSKEGRVVLSGDVDIVQEGGNLLRANQVVYFLDSERLIAMPPEGQQVFSRVRITTLQAEQPPKGVVNKQTLPATNTRRMFPISPMVQPAIQPGVEP
jgi:lipopolysaccharide export system protein LptA